MTYRLKRIESIIGKLKRHPQQEFDRMWDIAGCRCICKNENNVEKLHNNLKKNLTINKTNDHRGTNIKNGYSSLHLYVSLDKSDPIEIQLRTIKEHNWATFVEIIDLLYDKRIKEGEEDPEFIKFHFLLSRLSDLTSEEIVWILDFVEKFDIYNRLRSVFIKNYLEVRVNWMKMKTKSKSLFYILEVQKDSSPKLTSYNNYNEAESEYFNRYISGSKNNIVLIYIPFNNFDALEKAYSNYLLTMHSFIDDYFQLLNKAILVNLRNENVHTFIKYYRTSLLTLTCFIEDLQKEIKSINEHASLKEYKKEAGYWKKGFYRRIENTNKNILKINKDVAENEPKSFLKKYVFKKEIKKVIEEITKSKSNQA